MDLWQNIKASLVWPSSCYYRKKTKPRSLAKNPFFVFFLPIKAQISTLHSGETSPKIGFEESHFSLRLKKDTGKERAIGSRSECSARPLEGLTLTIRTCPRPKTDTFLSFFFCNAHANVLESLKKKVELGKNLKYL